MEKELLNSEKQLLLVDLSARLSYGVKGCFYYISENKYIDCIIKGLLYAGNDWWVDIYGSSISIDEIKPYLLPLSSMTGEQEEELLNIYKQEEDDEFEYKVIDFYNKNHFDYRNLIDKKLAIDCTNLNIY